MDLEAALTEAKLAVNLFFNNKFNEAEALMKPWFVSLSISVVLTFADSAFPPTPPPL